MCVCVCCSDLDVIDEGDVFALNGFLGPDQRRVRLGFLLLSLLHPAHGLSADFTRGDRHSASFSQLPSLLEV